MWLSLAGLCAAVLSLAGIFLYLDPQIPRPETYRNVQLETPLRVFADDGALLAEYGERRLIPVTLDQVPKHFINGLLDTEDKRFYQHSGIDFISLTNDALALVGTFVTEGELGGGASTITMQLARNVSFSLEQRFLRKFKEMLLAIKIERELTKDEILELYINIVPFGKRAYGAQAAALTYYGKSLAELTLPQLAMLAGIPQAPSAGNPINGPARALARRNLVLSRMHAQDSITEAEYEDAKATPISAKIFARELDVASPYAAEWVRRQASEMLPDLYSGGYEIHTTIDSGMQAEAIASLRRGLLSYDRRHGYRGAEDQATPALIASLMDAAPVLLTTLATDEIVEQPGTPTTAEPAAAEKEPVVANHVDYPAELSQVVSEVLENSTTYGGLDPAMVLAVNNDNAIAQLADGRRVTHNYSDSTWARTYINVDLRSPPPPNMHAIVAVGDVIRVHLKDDTWLLAQLPEIQGAIVSIDPATGGVRSLVGGFDFFRNQYNHALQAARQPGSGFKPFVYSSALAAGVTPADLFMDAPLVFDDENLESQYRPDNDNNRYNGPTRLREALYRSINLVSMRVMLRIGARRVIDHVANFGFDTREFPRNTQLAIGGGTMAVTPINMARAYSVLANGGHLVDPHIINKILDAKGREIFRANHPRVCQDCTQADAPDSPNALDAAEPASLADLLAASQDQADPDPTQFPITTTTTDGEPLPDTELDEDLAAATQADATLMEIPTQPPIDAPRVVDERNVFIMHSMLRDVIKRGTGRAARRMKRSDIGGKTGTTNDAADTWFNGYNPELVTTVWVGFSNHAPLGANAYGSNTPLPIWIDFMEDALAGTDEVFPVQPPGVVTMKIDPASGEPASPGQSNAIFEYFLREHAPQVDQTQEPPRGSDTEEIKAIDIF
jgi:penicillin-binding protein 1A